MGTRDIVAIGASAGGVDALLRLAAALRPDFPASVLITLHLSNQFRSSLDELMNRVGPLKAAFAKDGDPLQHGRIYLAPPDRHVRTVRARRSIRCCVPRLYAAATG